MTAIMERRIGPPGEPLWHVIDCHGYVWRIVRDGGMATRADGVGIITEGIAALERRAGPLRRLESDGGRPEAHDV